MRTKAIITVVVSLITGFILGFIISGQITRNRTKDVRAISSREMLKMRTFEIVNPTEEQKKALEPIIKDYSERFDSMNRMVRKNYHSLFDQYHDKLSDHLTDEQIHTLQEFTKSFHEKKRKHREEKNRNLKSDGSPPSPPSQQE